jgi:uncharacterized phage protein (TIGR02218 family)
MNAALHEHLADGATHTCYCWALTRPDGLTLGFTDHDRLIQFDGINFVPECGLSARALASTTGLSVNNTEALGVLQSDAISEADIDAGRYDSAQVTIWLVQWDQPEARLVRFAGTIGEITRSSGGFQAELRGLTDALNQPQGRSYLRECNAVLGDARCGFDLTDPAFSVTTPVETVRNAHEFSFAAVTGFGEKWFEAGGLEVLSGAAAGLRDVVKTDCSAGAERVITLWQPIRAVVQPGDMVRLTAGCDKRAATCRKKFSNFVNFRGFPDIPGDDWLVSVPRSGGNTSGGSRSR